MRATTAARSLMAVTGRAVCGVGSKLLGFGGECQGRLLPAGACTQFLHPDLQDWLPAPPAADAVAPQPAPRTAAGLVHCPRLHAAFLYGGQGEGGAMLGDLWRLDLGTMAWTRLNRLATCRPPASHDAPPPAAGAALAVTPDGSRLWLMGGRLEGGRCSSALHWCAQGVICHVLQGCAAQTAWQLASWLHQPTVTQLPCCLAGLTSILTAGRLWSRRRGALIRARSEGVGREGGWGVGYEHCASWVARAGRGHLAGWTVWLGVEPVGK